jgi:hypothetical protein
LTKRFAKVAGDAWHIQADAAINDGEVVVPYLDGTTGFSVLQNELNGRSNKTRHGRLLSSPTITANRTAVHHHPPPFLEALPVGRFCSIGPSPAKMNSLGLYTGPTCSIRRSNS